MSGTKKRTAEDEDGHMEAASPSQPQKKGTAAPASAAPEVDEMGEFEDPWEDEIEDDADAGEVFIEEDSSDEESSGDEADGAMDVDADATGPEAEAKKAKKEKKARKAKAKVTFEDDEELADLDAETYLPGKELAEGEVLVADMSTYEMLHPLSVEWPCLSFDILKDNLGASRTNVGLQLVSAGDHADTERSVPRNDVPRRRFTGR